MKKNDINWVAQVAVEDIPETGLHLEIEAPDATRAALAEFASVREVFDLSAAFDLTRQGAGVHVLGRVTGRVGQICVVTLEPIESAVDETVDLKFAPTLEIAGPDPGPKSLRQRKGRDDEAPEPLVDGTLDLVALAVEFLILGIDLYPRKAGAEFAAPVAEAGGERPFAALEALKKRPGGG